MKLAVNKINDELSDEQITQVELYGNLLMKAFDGQSRVTEIARYMDALDAFKGTPSEKNLAYVRTALAELRRYVDLLTRTTMTVLAADAEINAE